MKAMMFYRLNQDYTRECMDYAAEFNRLHTDNKIVEVTDSENIDKYQNLYSFFELPTIIVVSGDGVLGNLWAGKSFPMKDEVFGYMLNVG